MYIRFIILAASWAIGCSSITADVTLTDLGGLGGGFTIVEGISGNGEVVVGASLAASYEAFRWTETDGIESLGILGSAQAASFDGSVIVGAGRPSLQVRSEGFRWTENGITRIESLPGDLRAVPFDVSRDGNVIVGDSRAGQGVPPFDEAFRWTPADGTVELGFLTDDPVRSRAYALSDDGRVVVGFSESPNTSGVPLGGREAYRWTESEGMQGLGFVPGGDSSTAFGVSADGSIIVGESNDKAVRWDGEGTAQELTTGRAWDVSADGSVVVGESFDGAGGLGFIWDENSGLRTLNSLLKDSNVDPSDWQGLEPVGISDDGTRIVGRSGSRSFLIDLDAEVVPEPGSVIVWLIGIVVVCANYWMKRSRCQ